MSLAVWLGGARKCSATACNGFGFIARVKSFYIVLVFAFYC